MPDLPRIEWYPDQTTIRQGIARVVGVPQAYQLSWGDGASVAKDADDVYAHAYASAGPYLMSVTLVGQTEPVATRLINVLDATEPNVTITAPVGLQTIRVTFGGTPLPVVGRYTIDWTPIDRQEVLAEPGSYVERVFPPGTHTIRVTDEWSRLSLIQQVTVDALAEDPDFTVTPDAGDASGMSVVVEIDSVASAEEGDMLTIYWGDLQSEQIPAEAAASASHVYNYVGLYMVRVVYADNPLLSTSRFILVPFLE